MLEVGESVSAATDGDRKSWKTGSVSPLAVDTGGSRPSSACTLRALRSIARLIALRTASWLVGNLFRFGSRLLVCTGANQTWWLGLPATNTCWTPAMKLPPQSSWLVSSAESAAFEEAYVGNSTADTAGLPPQ